jgi:ubiquinone/menaquinone biosynthesis C-methylase UbiE
MTAIDDAALRGYYDRRAAGYEQIYHPRDDGHGRELGELARELREAVRDRSVLEVACGTGYWTAAAASVARSVTATDSSLAMLAVAREKLFPASVRLLEADAYDLDALGERFQAALAMFWVSHVPRARLRAFLRGLHRRLEPGAVVFLADNVHLPGLGGELVGPDAAGNTYKARALADGSRHRVLKNYFREAELRDLLGPAAQVRFGSCFWSARYFLP